MASQKSAPVAVTVIAYLVKSTQQQGLLALPAVVGQLAQIFIGSGLAAWLSGVVSVAGGVGATALQASPVRRRGCGARGRGSFHHSEQSA